MANTGVYIMLIPNRQYTNRRPAMPDVHCTLAYFGPVDDAPQSLYPVLDDATRKVADRPMPRAQFFGTGLFDVGSEGYAQVDLIDSIDSTRIYAEMLLGSIGGMMNLRHGFTPHITRAYTKPEDSSGAINIGTHPGIPKVFDFKFTAIGLWYGDVKINYEFRTR